MALGGLFKGKQQKQLERDMAIQGVLDLHRRRIRDLKKHEHGYCEKAVRAKRQGDKGNYQKLIKLLVQTMNERRRLDSALLTFEAMVQTKQRLESYGEFAKGLQSATKSIMAVFKNIDVTKMVTDLNLAMGKAKQMDRTMNMVLDRVSDTSLDFEPETDDETINFEQIDAMISNQAKVDDGRVDSQIDAMLTDIESRLKKEQA